MAFPLNAPRASAALGAVLAATCSHAADVQLSIELPRLKHRPYVAVWLERGDRERVADLALWHEGAKPRREGKKHKDKGDKYLHDLRHWWRSGGSMLQTPVDGVSGPTRPAGVHRLQFEAPLAQLPAGSYRLMVEASREDGGDEVASFAVEWPPRAPQELRQQGRKELGEVVLELRP